MWISEYMKKENVITIIATGVIASLAMGLSLKGELSDKDDSPIPTNNLVIESNNINEKYDNLKWINGLEEQRQQYIKQKQYEEYLAYLEQLRQEEERKRLAEIEAKKKVEAKKQEHNKQVNVTSSNSISYEGTFNVTFYTAHQASTGKSQGHPQYGITASGTTVKEGRTAACPKNLPFGTVVEIEGIGKRVCEDRGGAINNAYKIDIYVPTEKEAYSLGRQHLYGKVYK